MTGWIVFGCIMLFLIWLFTRHVTVTAVYDRDPEVRVKILFFTIVRVPPDPVKQKKKADRKAAKEAKKAAREAEKAAKQRKGYNSALLKMAEEEERQNAEESDTEQKASESTEQSSGKTSKKADKNGYKPPKKKKGGLPDISFDMIRDYIASASPPVKRLFKKIRIRDVYIDWVVGSEDAAKTALKYGGLCTAFYSAAEWLRAYMDAKIREINIEADFDAEKDDIFIYGTLRLRISTAIGCALWLGFRVIRTYLKYNGNNKTVNPRPARAGAQ